MNSGGAAAAARRFDHSARVDFVIVLDRSLAGA
jgi:hypothetical protein